MMNKIKENHHICKKEDNKPGKKTSFDQIVSSQPGFIPQMSGKLTNLLVMGATVFVDHSSDHVYIYLIHNIMLEKTLLAKEVYQCFLNFIGTT